MRGTPLVLLTVLLAVAGCRRGSLSDAESADRIDPADETAAAVPVTPTEYATSLIFLATESAPTPALVLEFTNRADQDGLHRSQSGWLLNRSGWRTLLDGETHEETTRAPWRLFPGEGVQLTVTADGEPDALVLAAGTSRHTLELGTRLDGWEDRAGTRHDIRTAQLTRSRNPTTGVVVQHRFTSSGPERRARFGPHESLVLWSPSGALIVVFHSRDPAAFGESFAWMYADGLTRRWTALDMRTVEVASAPELRRNIPVRFWFHILEPDIKGELSAVAREVLALSEDDGPTPYHALYRVRGWAELGGSRHDVVGVLERREP